HTTICAIPPRSCCSEGLGAAFHGGAVRVVPGPEKVLGPALGVARLTRRRAARRSARVCRLHLLSEPAGAAPLDLYAGLNLSQPQLEHELQRLSYHQVADLEQPGTYRLTGSRIDVALRAVQFADGSRPAAVLSVTFGPAGIQDM